MARHKSLDASRALHHMIGRVIEGTEIIREQDRIDSVHRLAELCREKEGGGEKRGGYSVRQW